MTRIASILLPVSMPPDEQLGPRIRRLRTERGWTQEQLADAAEISVDTAQRAEWNRDIRVSSFAAIAAALEISLDDLWRGSRADAE